MERPQNRNYLAAGDPILSAKDRNAQTLDEWIASPFSDHLKY